MDFSPDSVSHKFVTKFSDGLFTKFGDLEDSSPNLVINPSQKLTLNTLKLIPLTWTPFAILAMFSNTSGFGMFWFCITSQRWSCGNKLSDVWAIQPHLCSKSYLTKVQKVEKVEKTNRKLNTLGKISHQVPSLLSLLNSVNNTYLEKVLISSRPS